MGATTIPSRAVFAAGALLALPDEELIVRADRACRSFHGAGVFLRGLIEATNVCTRNCLYCGIRRGNGAVRRYRLSDEEILLSARRGYERGLRSFVLQGGEDPEFGAERLARLAGRFKEAFGDEAALTLSFGTLRREDYALLRSAGVDRYLLRFETSDEALHLRLRGTPLAERLCALDDLRSLGYEVGTGFMTGLPGSDPETLAADLDLASDLAPDMVGVGPFIPHPGTPLGKEKGAGLAPALRAVAALRLALPGANIPATTAAGSIAADGRERMLAAGANVLMPNIGPVERKKDYELYPGKVCLDEDGLDCLGCLAGRVLSVGKFIDLGRGDARSFVPVPLREAASAGRAASC
jgi:biotin synthase